MTIRSRVASKASRIVAQEVEDLPKEDVEAPAEGMGDEEPVEDVEAPVEDAPAEGATPSLEEKLDKLTETLTTLVDAISDQTKLLEERLTGEPSAEEGLEDAQEEETPEGEDAEFSPEEFGVDVDELQVANKEESLRSARKTRLAAKEKDETVADAFKLDKSKDLKGDAPAPTITKVKKSEIPPMLKYAELDVDSLAFDLAEDGSKWTVMKVVEGSDEAKAVETPVCEILADSVEDKDFANAKFAHKVISAMREHGVGAVLEKLAAKDITKVEIAEPGDMFKVEEDKKGKKKAAEELSFVEKKKEEAEEKKEEAKEEAEEKKEDEKTAKVVASNHKRKFNKALKLALVAMNKNLIDNPLKAALFDTLSKFDIDASDASKIIECAFVKAADEHFDVALKETDKFMNLSDEAFLQAESLIGDMNVRQLDVEDVEVHASVRASELSKRAERSSLVLSTASASDASDMSTLLGMALPKPSNWGKK